MDGIHVHRTRDIANHFFWVLLLQGVLAILIAIFVMIYPPIIIVPLIAAMFFWQGITAMFLASRVRRFWKEIPDMFA